MSKKPTPIKRTIVLYAKTADCFHAYLKEDGLQVGSDYEGYPPRFLGDGDGIKLEIDLDTGQIQNWKKPEFRDLSGFLTEENDDRALLAKEMQPGILYRRQQLSERDNVHTFEFSRLSPDQSTAIIHPEGEPDMQSSWGIPANTWVKKVKKPNA